MSVFGDVADAVEVDAAAAVAAVSAAAAAAAMLIDGNWHLEDLRKGWELHLDNSFLEHEERLKERFCSEVQ